MSEKLSASWKVPFRAIYCDTFAAWVRATIWCHFVARVFPYAHDFRCDAGLATYLAEPTAMGEQLGFLAREALEDRRARHSLRA